MKTKTANVVIGANFGDEGKGLVTDFLAAPYGSDSLVIRHNGGAQAGHTVQTPDGRRHVFNHFGSGSLAGAATFLSRFFVANPLIFLREKARLAVHGISPWVYIDPECLVTTPYDMMINQIVEETRGAKRHGSVGVGFGETIERSLRPAFTLCVQDLENKDFLAHTLRMIRTEWVPIRLLALGVGDISDEWRARLSSEGILEHFMQDCDVFRESVEMAGVALLKTARHICFEGAQGLLLDQERGWFPHVTRSFTGIRNATQLALEAGLEHLNVFYATRAYITRHGAGPLPHACEGLPYPNIQDATNVTNAYQGALRFAWPDLDLLGSTIRHDRSDAPAGLKTHHQLVITCLDQVDEQVQYVKDGERLATSREVFADIAQSLAEAENCWLSYGPTRRTLIPKTKQASLAAE